MQLSSESADAAIRSWLRGVLGRDVQQLDLYRAALTHRSAQEDNNERLEFLGDAVLGMVIAAELYRRFPAADEGDLSRLRSRLVSAAPLAAIGAEIGVGPMLQLGSGELKTGGFRRESILSDATEALFGAAYLEGGVESARALILKLLAGRIDSLEPEAELKDSKTRLQELLQGRGEALPSYVLESATGEPHEQVFSVRCSVQLEDGSVSAAGVGSGRRRAEQEAASDVLLQLTQRWSR
ncbi:MAG: ribonuclease III [Steroidobacteraceae bacterium]